MGRGEVGRVLLLLLLLHISAGNVFRMIDGDGDVSVCNSSSRNLYRRGGWWVICQIGQLLSRNMAGLGSKTVYKRAVEVVKV